MSTAGYEVVLQPRAERELNKVSPPLFLKMDAAIRSLGMDPRPFGVKKLEGDLHRIRLGDWRIVYVVLDQERRVVIHRVTRRSERTYKGLG